MAKVIVRAGKIGFVFILPILILALVLYVVNHSATAQVESEEAIAVSEDLFGAAKILQQSDQIPEAEAVYRRIMSEEAGTAAALDAARDRVFLYIDAKDGVAAEQCFKDLATGFASYAGYSKALLDIGDKYRQVGKGEEAQGMYQTLLTTHPRDENAIWARMGLAMLRISGSQEGDANPDIELLLKDYATDSRIAQAACLVADAYRAAGQAESARALYDFAGTIQPTSEPALWSKMGMVLLDIETNEYAAAKTETAELLAAFTWNEQSANAACRIADAWRKKGEHAQARAVYQKVVKERPNAEHALWSQMGMVISDLSLKNEPNAAVGVGALLQKHSKDNRIANAACQIADRYQEAGDHAMSKALYTYVVSAWPKEEHAIWCQKGLAVSEEKADPNSVEQLDRLLTKFAGHANLPLAAFLVGEGYRDAALKQMEEGKYEEAAKGFQRAVQAWEHIINLQKETAYTPEAFYILAECSYMAGQYDRAIYLYQYVPEKWPDFKLAWHSQFMVGYRYQQLKQAGLVEAKAADPQTAAAYKAVLGGYPTCPAAKAATNWLNEYGI
jgi:tetratricopeptide (TPR) repeat protein